MNASINLHPGPAAGFDDPFELLQACHERVARMLALLQRLERHLAEGQHADEPARSAARDLLRYFDLAAPQHHLDEELHVFPTLLASADPSLQALVQSLQADHRAMEQAWAEARPGLRALSDGHWPAAQGAAQFAAWQRLASLYAGHAASEDGIAFPAAQQRLDRAAQAAMGEEMARRRGVVPGLP